MMWLLIIAMACTVVLVALAALGIADTRYDDTVREIARLPRQRDGRDR